MSDFGRNLLRRRVPQIVGLYIAAMWMAVEMGDWVTDRFGLTTSLTSYLFVAMAILLPSVALLAYGHGAPGQDRWTKTEKMFVPANLIVAAVALMMVQPGSQALAAMETVTMEDEDGVKQTFEVAASGQVRRVYLPFFDNVDGDQSLDWLASALPWLLTWDLEQSIFINAMTPMNMSVVQRLKDEGYPKGSGAPASLSLDLARERNATAALGRFSKQGDNFRIDLQVYDRQSQESTTSFSVSGNDLLTLVDELSREIARSLDVPELPRRVRADLPVREYVSGSLEAIRATSEGMVAGRFDNDFTTAIERLEHAVELDPTFAVAIGQLAMARYFVGQTEAAAELIDRALEFDYKLSEDSRFQFKTLGYNLRGDYGKARKISRLWTEVSPDNAEAWGMLVQILFYEGGAYEEMLAAQERQFELDPANSTLKAIAKTEVALGRHQAARERLNRYLESEPEDSEALSQIAALSAMEGDFERARDALERSALIGSSAAEAEIEMVGLDIRAGDVESAERQLAAIGRRQLNPIESLKLLNRRVALEIFRGQPSEALRFVNELEPELRELLPPVQLIMTLGFTKTQLLALASRFDEALTAATEMREQLEGPLASIAEMAALSVYSVQKAEPELEAALEAADRFAATTQLQPTLQAIIDGARVNLLELRGDYTGAAQLSEGVLNKVREFAVLANEADLLAEAETGLVHQLILAGEYERASSILDHIFIYYPSYPYARLEFAKLQKSQGDDAGARETLGELLALWKDAEPEFISYKHAQKLAAELGLPLASN